MGTLTVKAMQASASTNAVCLGQLFCALADRSLVVNDFRPIHPYPTIWPSSSHPPSPPHHITSYNHRLAIEPTSLTTNSGRVASTERWAPAFTSMLIIRGRLPFEAPFPTWQAPLPWRSSRAPRPKSDSKAVVRHLKAESKEMGLDPAHSTFPILRFTPF